MDLPIQPRLAQKYLLFCDFNAMRVLHSFHNGFIINTCYCKYFEYLHNMYHAHTLAIISCNYCDTLRIQNTR